MAHFQVPDVRSGLRRERALSRPDRRNTSSDYSMCAPSHQALGAYLEAAEYPSGAIEEIKKIGMAYDFFLTHDMRDTKFIPRWRISIPSGFPL